MTDNTKKDQKAEVVGALENILSELDEQQLVLPALKIVEALEVLGSSSAKDTSVDD